MGLNTRAGVARFVGSLTTRLGPLIRPQASALIKVSCFRGYLLRSFLGSPCLCLVLAHSLICALACEGLAAGSWIMRSSPSRVQACSSADAPAGGSASPTEVISGLQAFLAAAKAESSASVRKALAQAVAQLTAYAPEARAAKLFAEVAEMYQQGECPWTRPAFCSLLGASLAWQHWLQRQGSSSTACTSPPSIGHRQYPGLFTTCKHASKLTRWLPPSAWLLQPIRLPQASTLPLPSSTDCR